MNLIKLLTNKFYQAILFILGILGACFYCFQKGKISERNKINNKTLDKVKKAKKAVDGLNDKKRNKIRRKYNRK